MTLWSAGPRALLGSLVLCVSPAVLAQQTYDIRDYFPLDQGDTWVYEVREGGKAAGKPLKVQIKGTKKLNGRQYVVCEQSNGVVDYYLHTDKGVQSIGGKGKSQIGLVKWTLKEPLIYPAACEVGTTYKQEIQGHSGPKLPLLFTRISLNMKVEYTLEKVEDCHVPAGTFRDCLRVKMVVDCGKIAGHRSHTVKTSWLAEGLGTVKCITKYANGSTEERVLKSAVIRGKRL